MVAVPIFVTEIELLPVDVDKLDFVGRTESDIGAFAGIDVTNNRLDKRAQISRGAMMHLQNNGGVAVVFYRLSFAEIVRGWHGSADVT